jgi:hypothetical protein
MKVNLDNLANLQNENTAITTINDNNDKLETAIENTLSRDGTNPNHMNAQLDMNGYRIINLPAPTHPTDPVRLQEMGTQQQATAEAIAARDAALAAQSAAEDADAHAEDMATLATTAAENAEAAAESIATKATTEQAEEGVNDTTFMTPLKTLQSIQANQTKTNRLPSLPMRTRPVVTFGGDSTGMANDYSVFLANANIKPEPYPRYMHRNSQGAMTWAMAYGDRRWTWHEEYDAGEGDSGKFHSGHNGAFASETHADMIQRLPRFLAKWKPQIHVIFSGINDLYEDCPASIVDYINDIDAQACQMCLDNGCYPILCCLPGRGPKSYTYQFNITPNPGWPDVYHDGASVKDPRYQYRLDINAGRKALADNSGGKIFYVDGEDIFNNQIPGNDFGYWAPLMTRDGVHPSAVANQPFGKRIADVINSMVNPVTPFTWVWDFSFFNRIVNPEFFGTGGTAGFNTTGVIPDNWTIGNINSESGGSCSVVSSVIDRGNYNALRLDFTVAGANAYEVFEVRPETVEYPHEPAGTELICEGTFSWGAFTGWREITPQIYRRENIDYNTPETEVQTFLSKGCATDAPGDYPLSGTEAPEKIFMQTHGVDVVTGVRGFNPSFQITVSNQYGPTGDAYVIIEHPRCMGKRTWHSYNS